MGPRISTFSQECGKCTILSSSHIKKEKNLKWKIKNGYHHISRNWRYTLTSAAAATTTALSVRLSGEGGGGCLVSSPDSQSMNIIRGMQSRRPYISLSLSLTHTFVPKLTEAQHLVICWEDTFISCEISSSSRLQGELVISFHRTRCRPHIEELHPGKFHAQKHH